MTTKTATEPIPLHQWTGSGDRREAPLSPPWPEANPRVDIEAPPSFVGVSGASLSGGTDNVAQAGDLIPDPAAIDLGLYFFCPARKPRDGTERAMPVRSLRLGDRRTARDMVLLAAIRQVESGGNDLAVGDGGQAHGPLQIHKALWDDECRRMGVRWPWASDAWSWAKSCAVARSYWRTTA